MRALRNAFIFAADEQYGRWNESAQRNGHTTGVGEQGAGVWAVEQGRFHGAAEGTVQGLVATICAARTCGVVRVESAI